MIGQLSLLTPPPAAASSMPVADALTLVADQWSRRLNHPIRVTGDPWHGYRLQPAERNPA